MKYTIRLGSTMDKGRDKRGLRRLVGHGNGCRFERSRSAGRDLVSHVGKSYDLRYVRRGSGHAGPSAHHKLEGQTLARDRGRYRFWFRTGDLAGENPPGLRSDTEARDQDPSNCFILLFTSFFCDWKPPDRRRTPGTLSGRRKDPTRHTERPFSSCENAAHDLSDRILRGKTL